ncbi:MAG: repressor LexA [Chthoniobacter sp.]|jgi:repressor LexA|nr:repressor LexA [Chthoniobacter sp.]
MLTERQQEVLSFLESEMDRNAVMPSTREIQEHFGFASQTAAVNHLKALQRKGAIQRLAGKARAVALASMLERDTIVDVPIFGQIAAGMPALAEQENEGLISIDAASSGLRKNANAFALRVCGDSMTDAHILDGDTVLLEFREPNHGDIVAALIDGETTLKRYLVKHGRPYLKAENSRYPDLIPAQELVVQGVLVALVRNERARKV